MPLPAFRKVPLDRLDQMVLWFAPGGGAPSRQERAAHRLLIYVNIITSGFALLYMAESYRIAFAPGVRLEAACFVLLYGVLLLFKATGWYRGCANLYLANCFGVSILGCSYFSGGIHSLVFTWFVLVPVTSVLLLGLCADTLVWSGLSIGLPIGYGVATALGLRCPIRFNEAYLIEFNLVCVAGLILIMLLVALTFDAYRKRGLNMSMVQNVALRRTILRERAARLRLQDALTQVRTLSGLLPICAKCKKIRDDKGYWNELECYLRDYTHVELSHGICPGCARELYPEAFAQETDAEVNEA